MDRSNDQDSLNFLLPMSWTTAGELTLQAVICPVHGRIESKPRDNIVGITRPLQARRPLTAAWLSVCLGADATGAPTKCPFEDDMTTNWQAVQQLYPMADGSLRLFRLPSMVWNHSVDGALRFAGMVSYLEYMVEVARVSARQSGGFDADVLAGFVDGAQPHSGVKGWAFPDGHAVGLVQFPTGTAMHLAPPSVPGEGLGRR